MSKGILLNKNKILLVKVITEDQGQDHHVKITNEAQEVEVEIREIKEEARINNQALHPIHLLAQIQGLLHQAIQENLPDQEVNNKEAHQLERKVK